MSLAFHKLTAEHFPFTITAHRADNDRVVWEQTIEAPESGLGSLYIPPVVPEHGRVWIEVRYANGKVERVAADE